MVCGRLQTQAPRELTDSLPVSHLKALLFYNKTRKCLVFISHKSYSWRQIRRNKRIQERNQTTEIQLEATKYCEPRRFNILSGLQNIHELSLETNLQSRGIIISVVDETTTTALFTRLRACFGPILVIFNSLKTWLCINHELVSIERHQLCVCTFQTFHGVNSQLYTLAHSALDESRIFLLLQMPQLSRPVLAEQHLFPFHSKHKGCKDYLCVWTSFFKHLTKNNLLLVCDYKRLFLCYCQKELNMWKWNSFLW